MIGLDSKKIETASVVFKIYNKVVETVAWKEHRNWRSEKWKFIMLMLIMTWHDKILSFMVIVLGHLATSMAEREDRGENGIMNDYLLFRFQLLRSHRKA